MKNLLLIGVCCLFLFSSCSQITDHPTPESDLAAIIDGTYQVTSVTDHGKAHDNVKGTIVFKRNGNKATFTTIDITFGTSGTITGEALVYLTPLLGSNNAGVGLYIEPELKTFFGSGTKSQVTFSFDGEEIKASR